MRRTSLIILAMGCLVSPIAAVAQQSGGTGNLMGVASAGAPTIEDNIDFVRKEIEKARTEKTIRPQRAESAEHRLRVIERKLAHLNRQVMEVRHSLH